MSYKAKRKPQKKLCEVCQLRPPSEVHHITPRYKGGNDDEQNLVDLCSACHHFAPNDKESFQRYKKNGGIQIVNMKLGIIFTLKEFNLTSGFNNDNDINDFVNNIILKIREANIIHITNTLKQ